MKRICSLCAALLLALTLFGCLPKKVHTDYPALVSKIRTIGILYPDLEFDDVHFGGIREKRDDWSDQTNKNIVAAATTQLQSRGFEVKVIPREGPFKESEEEIDGLFQNIVYSFRMHAAREHGESWQFPHKTATLDYSVGPLDDLLDAFHVDALFLVNGYGEGDHPLLAGGSIVNMALVNRTGALLWIERIVKIKEVFSSWDIKKPDHAASIVEAMFKKMPAVPK